MFRPARDDDLVPLRDLERAANLAALSHVFPPERYPFPDDAVLARWRLVVDDPSATVLVADEMDSGRVIAYVAYDDSTLRHLGVHPDHWGRGLATTAVRTALRGMAIHGGQVSPGGGQISPGGSQISLWCLTENHRARRLYEHLGWTATDEEREASWPPHPTVVRYLRPITPSDR
jgi:RimJ/RimL family protein N-acetyltransferase